MNYLTSSHQKKYQWGIRALIYFGTGILSFIFHASLLIVCFINRIDVSIALMFLVLGIISVFCSPLVFFYGLIGFYLGNPFLVLSSVIIFIAWIVIPSLFCTDDDAKVYISAEENIVILDVISEAIFILFIYSTLFGLILLAKLYIILLIIYSIVLSLLVLIGWRLYFKKWKKALKLKEKHLNQYFPNNSDFVSIEVIKNGNNGIPGHINLILDDLQQFNQELSILRKQFTQQDKICTLMNERAQLKTQIYDNKLFKLIWDNFGKASKDRALLNNLNLERGRKNQFQSLYDSFKLGEITELSNPDIVRDAGLLCVNYLSSIKSKDESQLMREYNPEDDVYILASQIERYNVLKRSSPHPSDKFHLNKWKTLRQRLTDIQQEINSRYEYLDHFTSRSLDYLQNYQKKCINLKRNIQDIFSWNIWKLFLEENEKIQLKRISKLINTEIEYMNNLIDLKES